MNRISRLVKSSILTLFSRRVFSHSFKLGRLRAGSIVLAILVGVAWNSASAQVSYTGTQRTLGSGFNQPVGVAVGGNGNVFVSDQGNTAVKEILAAGGYTTINTVGSGFIHPTGIAVDGSGNVFLADNYSCCGVQEILAAGGYTTVNTVGSGFHNPSGVAVDGSGNVFVSDTNNNLVKEIVAGTGGAASGTVTSGSTVVTLGGSYWIPSGLVVDKNGNVFVADVYNNAVKEILAAGGYTTVNTVGSGFNHPGDVAVDGSGNVYVADTNNNAVKEIVAGTGGAASGTVTSSSTVITLGSGFSVPNGVALDGSGNIFVGDQDNNAVKEIMLGAVNFGSQAVGTISTTVALSFTISSGTTVGSISVMTTGITGLDFVDAGSSTCTAITYGSDTNCVVNVKFTPAYPGTRLGAVEFFDGSGNSLATVYLAGTGTGPMTDFYPGAQSTVASSLSYPYGAAVDNIGNVYIADAGNSRVLKETLSSGSYSESTVDSGLSYAQGVAVDGAGNLYIAVRGNNSVVRETLSGGSYTQSVVASSSLNHPYGVAVDGVGNVYFSDTDNNRVLKETLSGGSYTESTVDSGLSEPSGVAVDGNGNVYVADANNNRVLKETPSGSSYTQSTIVSGLNYPKGVAVDGSGNVYIADTNNSQALMETLSGGSYTQSAVASGLNRPFGVAVDGSGNVYIAGTINGNALKVDVSDPPTLSFASTGVGSTSSDSPQTVTLWNLGNATLNFPVPGSGNNPSITTNFTLNSSGGTACPLINSGAGSPGTLALGTSCTLPISFSPLSGGSISGSLIVTDNTLNGSNVAQTIPLNGTATNVGTTTTLGSSLDPSTYGQSVTFTATVAQASGSVTPTGTVQFSVDGGAVGSPVTLSGGTAAYSTSALIANWHSITAVYTPASGSGFISSTSAELGQTVLPVYYTAPTEPVGTTSGTQTITIQLSSSFTLGSISVVTQGATGLDFNVASGGTCTIGNSYNPGDTCTVNYTFTPKAPGARMGAIVLSDNSTPTAVVESITNLAGTGTGPLVIFPSNTTTISLANSTFTSANGAAVDASGNVFVAAGGVYEMVAAGGVVSSSSTVIPIGSGITAATAVAVDGSGNVFVMENSTGLLGCVKEIAAVNGTVSSASPVIQIHCGQNNGAMAMDAQGNVYIIDIFLNWLNEILAEAGTSTSYTHIIAVKGIGKASGLAVDSHGNVFTANDLDNSVNEIVAINGSISDNSSIITVGSGFQRPVNLAVDAAGDVIVGEAITNQLKKIVAVSGVVSGASQVITMGSWSSPSPWLGSVTGPLGLDAGGNVYVTGYDGFEKFDLADPQSMAFYDTAAGHTSLDSPKTMTVANAGNANLTIPVLSGNNASISTGFTLDSSTTCPQLTSSSTAATLAPGPSCMYVINFSPVWGQIGSLSGQLVLTDTSLNATSPPYATQTVSLQGTVSPYATTITAANAMAAYSPGDQVVTLSATVTSALGTVNESTMLFTVWDGSGNQVGVLATSGTVTGGVASASFILPGGTVPGTYTILAAYAETATFAHSWENTHTFTVVNTNFGSINVGSTSTTVAIPFNFNSAVTVGSWSVLTQGATGLDFADTGTGTCAAHSYAAGSFCTVGVNFTPRVPGQRNGAVVLYDPSGNVLATVYITGTGMGPMTVFYPGTQSTVGSGLDLPFGVALDGSGNIYIADSNHNRVLKETLAGGIYTQSTVVSGLNSPFGVAVDGAGNLYIADTYHSQVLKETPSGGSYTTSVIADQWSNGLSYPGGVAVDGSGNVYIADSHNNRVLMETLSGGSYTQSVIGGSSLAIPEDVAVDGSGNVYIADSWNNQVLKVPPGDQTCLTPGDCTTVGSGLAVPVSLAVDGVGNVYIADSYNYRVLMETLSGGSYTQSVIMNSGLSYTYGVAVDGHGNVYIANSAGDQVLKVDVSDPPAQSFVTTLPGATSTDSPKTVTLWNLGNATLNLPKPSSGNNPSMTTNFTLNSSGVTACPLIASTAGSGGTLALGRSCTLPISFAPTVGGSHSGALTLTDNNLNGNNVAQPIPLSGFGGNSTTLTLDASPSGSNLGQAVTLTATLGVPGNNLVINGGFESGDFTGWNNDGNESVDGFWPNTGNYSADFTSVGSYGTISQTLTTTAGASYTLSFWLANTVSSSGDCDFKVSWNGTAIGDINGCSFPYTQFTYTVTGTGSDILSFAGETISDDTLLDDVSVLPVVSPVSLSSTNGELVSFYNNGSATPLATSALHNGVATLQTTALPEGSNNLTATYPGDASLAPSLSTPATVQVAGAPTQLVILTGTPQSATINTVFAIPLTVEVEDAHGIPVPGTTVTFQVTPASNGASAALSTAASSTGCASTVFVAGTNIKLPTRNLFAARHPMVPEEGEPASITPGCAAVIATANGSTGSYIVTATSGSLSATFNLTNVAPVIFTVTTEIDDATGIATNCTNQSLSGATLDSNCSLRDAMAAVAASHSDIAPIVNFAHTLTTSTGTITPSVSTPGVINIDTGGRLYTDSNMIIQGPGANVLSVASANLNRIFYFDSDGIYAISGLTITGGHYTEGSGIKNFGTLTVNNCTISNNTATTWSGGGIHNSNNATLTVINSTISNNTAANNGGGIVNYGTLTVIDSTFSGNSAPNGNGGGLYNYYTGIPITYTGDEFEEVASARTGVGGSKWALLNRVHPFVTTTIINLNYNGTATVTNSTFSGNSDGNSGGGIYTYSNSSPSLALANNLIRDPVNGSYIDILGNLIAGVGNVTSSNTLIAPLGYYGGQTQTMPPLPGNIGICAGLAVNLPAGVITDQRGTGFPQGNIIYPGYSAGIPCVDAGAVQTNYALSFTREPPSSMRVNAAFTSSNAPQVTLTESGSTATFVSGAVSASGSPGSLSGNSVALASGVGSYSGLSVTSGASNEQLTARLGLNASLNTPLSITATSNTFSVIGITLSPTSLSSGTVGVGYSATITASGGSGSYTYTESGTLPAGITLNRSTGVLSGTPTAGGTFNITVTATDSTSASASQQYTLTIAPPTITLTPATLPSGTDGAAYSQSVSASGGTSPYIYALATGSSLPPGLSLNSSTGAITGTPTTASASAYTFTIIATDSSTGTGPYRGSQNFSLTINKGSQTISFTPSSPVTYGVAPITLSATGGGSGNPVTFSIVSGPGSITGSTLTITGAGTVVVAANQTGNTNFTAATQVTKSIVVNQAATAVRLACGTIPTFLQSAFTLSATVSSSAGTPTGSVSFLDGSTPLGSSTVSGGVAAVTISSLAMGTHSVTAAYGGDTNFLASISGPLTQLVEDFSVSVASSSGSAQTAPAGGTATYSLVVSPMGGSTFPSAVTLSVSGLPTGATATLTPQIVPGGASTTNVALTIQAPSMAANIDRKIPFGGKAPPLLWGILLLPFAGSMRRVRKRLGRKFSVLLLMAIGVAAMAGLSSCSSTNGFYDQSTKSFTIVVTGTSGALSHSTTVTLTVQ